MIVMRREDFTPSGRYAGGRLAPPGGVPGLTPDPSPAALRRRAQERIQDRGYLRAQRTPEENRALATARAFNGAVRQLADLAPGLDRSLLQRTASQAESRDFGFPAGTLELTGIPDADPDRGERPGTGEAEDAFDIAQRSGGPRSRLDLLRRFLDRIDRTERGRRKREQSAREIQQREVQTEIVFEVERSFARTGKSKVEIELKDIRFADIPASAIREFTRLWRRGDLKVPGKPDATVQLNLRKVSDEEAAAIAEKTGLDVKGFVHSIDTHALGHAFRRHGPGNEHRPNQMPISEDSIAMMLEIISDPDNITSVRSQRSGTKSITHEKRINGHVIFVEQARTTKRTLSLVTHYIRKR